MSEYIALLELQKKLEEKNFDEMIRYLGQIKSFIDTLNMNLSGGLNNNDLGYNSAYFVEIFNKLRRCKDAEKYILYAVINSFTNNCNSLLIFLSRYGFYTKKSVIGFYDELSLADSVNMLFYANHNIDIKGNKISPLLYAILKHDFEAVKALTRPEFTDTNILISSFFQVSLPSPLKISIITNQPEVAIYLIYHVPKEVLNLDDECIRYAMDRNQIDVIKTIKNVYFNFDSDINHLEKRSLSNHKSNPESFIVPNLSEMLPDLSNKKKNLSYIVNQSISHILEEPISSQERYYKSNKPSSFAEEGPFLASLKKSVNSAYDIKTQNLNRPVSFKNEDSLLSSLQKSSKFVNNREQDLIQSKNSYIQPQSIPEPPPLPIPYSPKPIEIKKSNKQSSFIKKENALLSSIEDSPLFKKFKTQAEGTFKSERQIFEPERPYKQSQAQPSFTKKENSNRPVSFKNEDLLSSLQNSKFVNNREQGLNQSRNIPPPLPPKTHKQTKDYELLLQKQSKAQPSKQIKIENSNRPVSFKNEDLLSSLQNSSNFVNNREQDLNQSRNPLFEPERTYRQPQSIPPPPPPQIPFSSKQIKIINNPASFINKEDSIENSPIFKKYREKAENSISLKTFEKRSNNVINNESNNEPFIAKSTHLYNIKELLSHKFRKTNSDNNSDNSESSNSSDISDI